MKRIAILTQPLHINYGGLLQAYALQHTLREMGHHVVTDRHRNPLARRVVPVWCRNVVGDMVRCLVNKLRGVTPHHALIGQVGGNFTRFIETNMDCVELFDRNGNPNSELLSDFDSYVVGSDQVWRPSCNAGEQGRYFLDFVEGQRVKRIAYSASFGVDNLSEYSSDLKAHCSQLLRVFDAVSLREASGVELCRNEFGVKATHTLDPTLLLERSKYEELCVREPKRSGFMGCYTLDNSVVKHSIADEVANHLKLKKMDIGTDYSSVESWIAAFRDTDFIVTDSFHGTVFSIIFERPFITIVNTQRGASRFYSLLEALGLGSRAIDIEDHEAIDLEHIISRKIDYKMVSEQLQTLKKGSLSFLEGALK